MEDESINLISNDYERETAKLRTEHRRQIEDLREKLRTEKNLNDVFKATYQGMEAFYTFPRSMEMKAEDVFDWVKPEHFDEK